MKKTNSAKNHSKEIRKQTNSKKKSLKTAKPLKKKINIKKNPAKKVVRSKDSYQEKIIKPLPRRRLTSEEIAFKNALEQFANAVKLFNNNEFAKARAILERLSSAPAPDLAERARIYLHICNQRLSKSTLHLKTVDDFYNHGIQLANQGNFEEAEESLKKALKLAPESDYIHYALATTQALRKNAEGALEYLRKAIELNPQNRFLAQKDPDFSNLEEDPRFTEMIYPEKVLPKGG
ncbi:MAG: tetratricopeptide repeat protein [Acidobacteria bacterium]|nr:tetratricopeptide repeat protein [Acidobacteriota bacterium]